MEDKNGISSIMDQLDLYGLVHDVLKNIVFILLAALAASMIADIVVRDNYHNSYTTTATFVVTSKNSSNYAYSNLNAASSMADSYSNILNSSLLKKKVCQDLGISTFDAKARARVIADTNLMTLSVTSSTPQKAYLTILSDSKVLRNREIRKMMMNEGNTTPKVAQNAPRTPPTR